MDPREIRQQRANLIHQARQILEAAEGDDNRELTQEEQNQWDRLMDDADKLREKAERIDRQLEQERSLGESQGEPAHRDANPGETSGEEPPSAEERMARFRRFLPLWIARDYNEIPSAELRALQADLDTAGGYLRPPEEFVNEIIQRVDDMTFIRELATTFTVTAAESMGVPTLETDPADADWTSELATGSEDTAMDFGKRKLTPHPLAKRIKISRKLIRAVPDADTFVRDRLAYKFGITFEKACLTGTGSGQPLGLFTASSDGISTSRDVSSGNTTTEIQFDGLKEAKYTLKGQYWSRAQWMFHRDAVKQISKIKDSNGQYIWSESVRVGEPDRLLGLPVRMSEYVPNTFTTGQYVGLLGDIMNYWIVDALTMTFQVLQELYAETNQVGLIGRMESDGQPVLEEAFVRVTLA